MTTWVRKYESFTRIKRTKLSGLNIVPVQPKADHKMHAVEHFISDWDSVDQLDMVGFEMI